MRQMRDRTGDRHGSYTVLRFVGIKKNHRHWECRCDCGTVRTMSDTALHTARKCRKCCGGSWASGKRAAERVDYTGKRYGRLTVLREDGHIGAYIAWLVRCDCGVEKRLRPVAFSPHPRKPEVNHTRSCGCLLTDMQADVSRAAAVKKADRRIARLADKAANPHPNRKVQIDSDIEAKLVSRQRKLQLQWARMGLCPICGTPGEGYTLCAAHRKRMRERYVAVKTKKATRMTPSRAAHLSAVLSIIPTACI